IGGTNIRLSMVNKNAEMLHSKFYKCADYPTLYDVLKHYITETKITPKKAVIAIAAAILGDHIVMTNYNWEFSIKELSQKLGLDSLKIINDFEAQALAVEHLTKEDVKVIHKVDSIAEDSCRAIAGAGTGFGNALLYLNGGKWNIIPTEIGHSVIGSCNSLEDEIFQYVRKHYNVKESYGELFISGNGIVRIYNALKEIKGISGVGYTTAYDISVNAKTDVLAKQTIDVFYGLLGTLLCNIALSYLPYGGIYLTGGIIPQTLTSERESILVERFLDRKLDTITAILKKIPICLITKENPALLGLARFVSGELN
ncbi:MAG: glucokinase, partial [Alphaproteobacteria bacterium]|nr:glucokinase [Alphaproteobacteria bacterium]